MVGDGDVMLDGAIAGQPDMATGLARRLVAKFLEGFGQRHPAYRAGQLHNAITSSLTKWRRIIFGAWSCSK